MSPCTRRVLLALREAGETGVTTAQLCQPDVGGVRFSARILELRDVGCVIARRQVRSGCWRYWLVSEDAGTEERAA